MCHGASRLGLDGHAAVPDGHACDGGVRRGRTYIAACGCGSSGSRCSCRRASPLPTATARGTAAGSIIRLPVGLAVHRRDLHAPGGRHRPTPRSMRPCRELPGTLAATARSACTATRAYRGIAPCDQFTVILKQVSVDLTITTAVNSRNDEVNAGRVQYTGTRRSPITAAAHRRATGRSRTYPSSSMGSTGVTLVFQEQDVQDLSKPAGRR
jgi:hypothetical protein